MSASDDLTRVSFRAVADDYLDGTPIRRLMLCLRTIGCAHYRSPEGGCRMCAFPLMSTAGRPVAESDLLAQLADALDPAAWAAAGLAELDLYCAGSFFNDEEVPPAVRQAAYRRALALPGLRKLLVETRPEYVRPAVVLEALAILGRGVRFEVALGLESASTAVREGLIHKGFTLADFDAALGVLGAHDVAALAYVLLKPPGLAERAALDDAVATVRHVFAAGRAAGLRHVTAAVQPVFVQADGVLEPLYRSGEYRPPWLWTVVELIRRVHGGGELQIGTADDTPPPIAVRANCGRCDAAVEAAIARYNRTLDLAALQGLDCPCRADWRAESGILPLA